jgi:hypothetical protein
VSARKLHEIWIEQCEAAESIKQRYGLKAALDYVVGEKLLNFAFAAAQHPTFARELPRFVAQVRHMFTPEQIRTCVERIERDRTERDAAVEDDGDAFLESPTTATMQSRQFQTIKELLIATQIGTS